MHTQLNSTLYCLLIFCPIHARQCSVPNTTHPCNQLTSCTAPSPSLPQVKVRICSLYGCLPGVRRKHDLQEAAQPTAAFAVAQLVAGGEVLGLEAKTTYAETMLEGCNWGEWLTFCVKVGAWSICT
jgi:hypothetical protein